MKLKDLNVSKKQSNHGLGLHHTRIHAPPRKGRIYAAKKPWLKVIPTEAILSHLFYGAGSSPRKNEGITPRGTSGLPRQRTDFLDSLKKRGREIAAEPDSILPEFIHIPPGVKRTGNGQGYGKGDGEIVAYTPFLGFFENCGSSWG